MLRALLIACGLLIAATAEAAETRNAVPGAPPPAARAADLAWMTGLWEGKGIGGEPAAEGYSRPMGGAITGHFTQMKAGQVWFHEIITILETGGSLEMRLKHVNADMTGWEEKDSYVRFPLVAVAKDAWFFDGLTIRRDGRRGMITAVQVKQKDGSVREAVFHYRRAG